MIYNDIMKIINLFPSDRKAKMIKSLLSPQSKMRVSAMINKKKLHLNHQSSSLWANMSSELLQRQML